VTTHLQYLEKSGNSKMFREKSGEMGKVRGSEIRCVFSSSKYSKNGIAQFLCHSMAFLDLRPFRYWNYSRPWRETRR